MNAIVKHPLQGEVLSPHDTILVVSAMHPLKTAHDLVPVPTGSSVEEIVRLCGETSGVSRLVAGAHVSINGHVIPPGLWNRVRVKAGAHVMVRAFPRGGSGGIIKSILQIALVVVATVFAGPAGFLAGTALEVAGSALVGAAILFGGSYLLNSLFPPSQTKADAAKQVYSIASRQNEAARWGPIPVMLGRQRVAPKYASSPYTEFVGDDQYLRMLFVWGQGPLDISDIRIGETSIDSFDDVEIQTFSGYPTDGQQTLYPSEVVQTDYQIELSSEDPQPVRGSAAAADEIIVDLVAPQGIIDIYKDGKKVAYNVWGRVELLTPGMQTVVHQLGWHFEGKTQDPIRKSVRFSGLGGSGPYDVRVVRTTPIDDGVTADTVVWTALKTVRNSPPIEYHKPLAITALRIRATKQLNGAISDLTAVVSSRAKSWNGNAWVDDQPSRNPADLFRLALQGPGNARPVPNSRLDLPGIEAWADFCTAKGFTFDMYRDFKSSVRETLADICAAGRAVPIFRDGLWSVAMEDVFAPTVQHFTPRNSSSFTWTQAYQHLPHALRVKFLNADKDWIEDERIVYDDGYSAANATLFEQVEFPGVTNPELIFKHARYRIAERKLRPALYRVTVDFEHLICTRGDRVHIAHDVIRKGQTQGRIRTVAGNVATLDEPVTMVAGQSYGMRVRRADGSSVVLAIATVAGEHHDVAFTGAAPAAGDLFMFGLSGQETGVYRILAIRPGEDFSADIDLVDDAPGISIADTGPIVGDPGVVITPTPLVQLRPRNLAMTTQVALRGGEATLLSSLIWVMPFGPDVASYEVVGTFEGGVGVRAVVDGASQNAEFYDLNLGNWSFVVRAILTDGRATPYSLPLVVQIAGAAAALGAVVDLALVNAVAPGQFAGTDAEFAWSHTWAANTAAGTNPLYAGNVVRVFDVGTGQMLREEQTSAPRYVYTIARNTADAAKLGLSARRNLRVEVAVVDVYGGVSPFVQVLASNPPPPAITPTIVQGFGLVHVKWTLPPDPDIAGVIMWSEAASGYDPYATEPVYQGLGTSMVVPVPVGASRFVRIAAYDTFGVDSLNLSQELEVTSLDPDAVIDVTPPSQPNPPTGTSAIGDDGMARVTWSWVPNNPAAPENEDLVGYDLELRIDFGGGSYSNWQTAKVGLDAATFVTAPPGTVLVARVRAYDARLNYSAYSTEATHVAAVDTVPPVAVTGLTVTAGFETLFLKWDASAERDVSHYQVYVSGRYEEPDGLLKVAGTSLPISGLASGNVVYVDVRAVDTSGNVGPWTGGASGTPTVLDEFDIEAALEATEFAQAVAASAPKLVPTLPAPPFDENTPPMVVLTSDGRLYRRRPDGSGWDSSTAADQIVGQLIAAQIAAGSIGTDQLAAGAVATKNLAVADFENYVENYDLRRGNEGWVFDWPQFHSIIETPGYNDSPFAIYGTSDGSSITAAIRNRKSLPISAGQRVYVGGWTYRNTLFSGTLGWRVSWRDYDGLEVSTSEVFSPVGGFDVWEKSGGFVVAPAGVGFARCELVVLSHTAGQFVASHAELRRAAGVLIEPDGITAPMIQTAALTAKWATIQTAIVTSAQIVDLNAAKIQAGTNLAGSITVDEQYALNDPAAGVNAGTTKVDPGKVLISGPTTLQGLMGSWAFGGDYTLINGGAIAAQTIDVTKLRVGLRGLDVDSIVFSTDPATNTMSWTAGRIWYLGDNGSPAFQNIVAGSYQLPAGTNIAAAIWIRGRGYLDGVNDVTHPGYMVSGGAEDCVVLAKYTGGTNIVTDVARTLIEGDHIKTGTIKAQQIDVANARAAILDVTTLNAIYAQAGTLVVTDAAYFNQLTGNAAFIANIKAGVLTAGSVTTEMLQVGSSQNLVRNSDFAAGATGWSVGGNMYVDAGGALRFGLGGTYVLALTQSQVAYIQQLDSNGAGDIYWDTYSELIPVAGGVRYQASAYVAPHRCDGTVFIVWYDGAGAQIGNTPFGTIGNTGGGQGYLASYTRASSFGTAPGNAGYARIFIRKSGTTSGSDSFLFFTRSFFGEALPAQVVPSPWAPAAQTVIGPGFLQVSGADYSALPVGGDNLAGIAGTAGTAYGWAADPAVRVNAGSTNITGNKVRTGIIVAENGKMIINLNSGTIEIYD